MAFSVRRRAIVVAFLGSLACKIEKTKNPNCDAYHLRVSIFAVKVATQACLNLVGASREQGVNACWPRTAISQRTQLVLGLATRQSQSLEIVEAMAAVAP